MMILIIMLFGTIAFSRLGLDMMPELEYPAVSVVTTYEGVSSEDIENLITKPIEGVVSSIKNVKNVTSTSQEGVSAVIVEFEWGVTLDFAAQDTADIAAPLFDARGNLLRCPNCGSDNVEEITISPIIRMLAIILLLGLPLLVARKRVWVCRDCDWDSTRYAEGVPEKDADPDA